MDNEQTARRAVGEAVIPFVATTLAHGELSLPGPSWTHLSFRRFAGCPVCNLHLKSMARGNAMLIEAGILSVAFFHSSAELMLPYQGELPFPCVPDPERHYYRQFGVERSAVGLLHPKVMGAALGGLFRAPSNPLAGGLDPIGLPADFLISSAGVIVAAKYGRHADDQWSLEDLLQLVELHGPSHSAGA